MEAIVGEFRRDATGGSEGRDDSGRTDPGGDAGAVPRAARRAARRPAVADLTLGRINAASAPLDQAPAAAAAIERAAEEKLRLVPRFVLTGERHRRRHLAMIDGRAAWLPTTLFAALCRLAYARCTTCTGFVPESSITICRLRDLLDAADERHGGPSLIETGDGQEYRLTVNAGQMSIDPSFAELPSPYLLKAEEKRVLLELPQLRSAIDLQSD
jgi:hypothetical protein